LFYPHRLKDSRRKMPDLLQPNEGTAVVAQVQLKTYIFNNDFTKIVTLKEPRFGAARGAGAQELQRVGTTLARPGAGGPGGIPGLTKEKINQIARVNPALAK